MDKIALRRPNAKHGKGSMMTLYCDGGTTGSNPGTSVYWSVGWDVEGCCDVVVRERSTQYKTNNAAEYLAVLSALQFGYQHRDWNKNIIINSDSQLIVNQINGSWKCKDESLKVLLEKTKSIMTKMKSIEFKITVQWVSRKENVKRLGH